MFTIGIDRPIPNGARRCPPPPRQRQALFDQHQSPARSNHDARHVEGIIAADGTDRTDYWLRPGPSALPHRLAVTFTAHREVLIKVAIVTTRLAAPELAMGQLKDGTNGSPTGCAAEDSRWQTMKQACLCSTKRCLRRTENLL
jgi:hypothetical protein